LAKAKLKDFAICGTGIRSVREVSGNNFDLSLLSVSRSERRHGSTRVPAMSSLRDVLAHDGDLCTFSSWKPVDWHYSLSARLHVCLSLFTCLPVCMYACLPFYLSSCQPASLPVCISAAFVLFTVSFSVCLYIPLSVRFSQYQNYMLLIFSQINMSLYCFFRLTSFQFSPFLCE
jgi:hypothetical protein